MKPKAIIFDCYGVLYHESGRSIFTRTSRNDELVELVRSLSQRGYLVGMLSNIGRQSMDKLFPSEERGKLFDSVVLSGEVGLVKPQKEIYQLIAKRLGVDETDCIMIDDVESNCQGAEAAGMKSIHYIDNEQLFRQLQSML